MLIKVFRYIFDKIDDFIITRKFIKNEFNKLNKKIDSLKDDK